MHYPNNTNASALGQMQAMQQSAAPGAPAPMSEIESNMHSASSSMGIAQMRLQGIISRLTGPVPVGIDGPGGEHMSGLIALSQRNSAQAQDLYELVEKLGSLL